MRPNVLDRIVVMELHKAISQISEIHAQLHRTEVFSGTRALPMAITSGLALVAAAAHAAFLDRLGVDGGLQLWIGYALLSAVICGVDIVRMGGLRERQSRRQALFVVSQFLPALVVGVVVTTILFPMTPEARALLPGLWTLLFAVGIFSSAPSLPRGLKWVAGFYLVAGTALLVLGSAAARSFPVPPPPWSIGLTFAVGQAAVAWVLNDERRGHGR